MPRRGCSGPGWISRSCRRSRAGAAGSAGSGDHAREIVRRLERGEFPAADFGVTLVRADRDNCVLALTADDLDHPRLLQAQRHRSEIRAWQDPYGGLVLLGRGLAGRLECAVEVAPERRGRGDGRRLARAARLLAPAGVPLWAQVTPGNAASLRAFLAAGFRPIGSEALLVRSASEVRTDYRSVRPDRH